MLRFLPKLDYVKRSLPLAVFLDISCYNVNHMSMCHRIDFTCATRKPACSFGCNSAAHYSCGLSTAAIEYLCPYVCLSVSVSVCLCTR